MSASRHPAAGKLLIVAGDDESQATLVQLLTAAGYAVTVASTTEMARNVIRQVIPDVVLVDLQPPDISGYALCRRLKADPATRLIPVVLVTAAPLEPAEVLPARDPDADEFIARPINPVELRARVGSLVRVRRLAEDAEAGMTMIMTLAAAMEARLEFAIGHGRKVAEYAAALGHRLGLPKDDLAALHTAGILHDIGNIVVPDAVPLKAAALTDAEVAIVRQHPLVGDELCSRLHALRAVRPIVRSHHERLDGSGYPDGLRGYQMPVTAQLLSIADSYDAMTSDRPYRAAFSTAEALAELRREAERGWRRPDIVDTFADLAVSGVLTRLATANGPSIQSL